MKNSTYWEKRVANKTWNIYNSLEEINKALMEIYKEASLDIEEELFQIAKKIKTSTPTLSDMHKYNRLGKLKDNINDTIKQLGKKAEKRTTNQITKAFLDNYENTMKELGVLEYSLPNKKLIESLLKFPWSGENFSNRLWENTRVLERNLNEIMVRGMVQGKTIVEMATELDSRMMKGFNEAHRLVRTETMHYLNESSLRAYMDSGVKEVQLWAAIDERTCPVCGVKHGNKYRLKDAPVLPLHANCRCTYIPTIDIDDTTDVEEINTIEYAKNALINKVGFKEIEDSFIENIDSELIIKNTRQLQKLEDKFCAIHNSEATISSGNRFSKDTIAYVHREQVNPTRQNLSLNADYYSNFKKMVDSERELVKAGYSMPKALTDEELSISSVTHEYGHILQNVLVKNEMELKGWSADKPNEFLDLKKKTTKSIFKWYDNIDIKTRKQHYNEIIDIAKNGNPKFDFNANMSRYGKTNYEEFFAEVFANSQLSKPNELGRAMQIWLKEKELGI